MGVGEMDSMGWVGEKGNGQNGEQAKWVIRPKKIAVVPLTNPLWQKVGR
jgi:hypothetical protein